MIVRRAGRAAPRRRPRAVRSCDTSGPPRTRAAAVRIPARRATSWALLYRLGTRARVLYAGVALFVALAAFTARSIWIGVAASDPARRAPKRSSISSDSARRSRPTDAPGAMAWLRLELEQYGAASRPTRSRARCTASFAAAGDRVPDELRRAGRRARARRDAAAPRSARFACCRRRADAERRCAGSGSSTLDGETLRRHAPPRARRRPTLADATSRRIASSTPSCRCSSAAHARRRRARSRAAAAGRARRPRRRVRCASTRSPRTARSSRAVGRIAATIADAVVASWRCSARGPALPTFAPEEFFFRFDPAGAPPRRAAYSGFYLDLGGRGLVSTLLRPIAAPRTAQRGVIALDLAFDVDWRAFAAVVEPPVVGAAVDRADAGRASWSALDRGAAGRRRAGALRDAPSRDLARARTPDRRPPSAVAAAARRWSSGAAPSRRFRSPSAPGC